MGFAKKPPKNAFKEPWDKPLWGDTLAKWQDTPTRKRLFPFTFPVRAHFVVFYYETKDDRGRFVRKTGKTSKPCLRWDPQAKDFQGDWIEGAKCPWCDIKKEDKKGKMKSEFPANLSYYAYVLDRATQKKAKGDPTVEPCKISGGLYGSIGNAVPTYIKETLASIDDSDPASVAVQEQILTFLKDNALAFDEDEKAIVMADPTQTDDDGNPIDNPEAYLPDISSDDKGMDLLISYEGEGIERTYSAVVKSLKNSPLTDDEKEAYAEARKKFPFEKWFYVDSYETSVADCKRMFADRFAEEKGDEEEDDEEEAAPPPKRPASKKPDTEDAPPARRPKVSEDDVPSDDE
jgi:hypothetical protein